MLPKASDTKPKSTCKGQHLYIIGLPLVGIEGKAVEKHVNIVLIIRVIIFHPMDLYPSFFFMVFSVYTVFATIYQVFEFLNWYKGAVCGMPFNINLLDPKQSTNQLTTD